MDEPSVRGVALAQYAAVHAAVAEGIAIEAALADEGIEPSAWPEIEEEWQEHLFTDEEAGGLLLEAYDAHLVEAQDKYVRRIPPLDEDIAAWFRFLRAFAEQADTEAFLGRLEISARDVLRLHRAWARRLAADEGLRKEAFTALQRASEGDLPIPRPERPQWLDRRLAGDRRAPVVEPQIESKAPSLLAPFPGKVRVPLDNKPRVVAPPRVSEPGAPVPSPAPKPEPLVVVPAAPPPVVNETIVLAPEALAPEPAALVHSSGGTIDMALSAFPSLQDAPESEPQPAQAAAAAGGPPTLTLEQYAILTAELLVRGGSSKLYAKYGLEDRTIRQATLDSWADRLRDNPAEYEQWQAIYLENLTRLGLK